MFQQLPQGPTQGFEPVAPLYFTNFFIGVAANARWKDLSDPVKAAKAKPKAVARGGWGIGSVAHTGGAMREAATASPQAPGPHTAECGPGPAPAARRRPSPSPTPRSKPPP